MEEIQAIKERNSKINVFQPLRKTVLLCTNGFQTTDTHDSLPMQEYFLSTFANDYPFCEIELVKLFEPSIKKTHKTKYFEEQLENAIEKYIKKDYIIYLMGYSFSAALVCKMAYKYKKYIPRVILVAPVYDTIINNAIPHYIKYAYKFHKLNKRYGKKVAKAIGRQTVQGLPKLLLSIFKSILVNKKYFKRFPQPTLLIRGLDDILCTNHAIKKVQRKLNNENELYLYPKMSHSILKTVRLNGIVYEDILHFAFDTPYHLETKTKLIAKEDKKEYVPKEKTDEDGQRIPTFDEIFSQLDPLYDDRDVQQENEI